MNVRADPKLSSEERETTIRYAASDDRLSITSEITSVIGWLKEHPEFSEDWRRQSEGELHAISGTLPIGTLKLSGTSRKDQTPSATLGKLPSADDSGGEP